MVVVVETVGMVGTIKSSQPHVTGQNVAVTRDEQETPISPSVWLVGQTMLLILPSGQVVMAAMVVGSCVVVVV